jgi:holo-[acyl-carrier protein] synthase
MIIGIGLDLIETARIEKSIKSDAFVRRIFTEQEVAYCTGKAHPAQSFAARFAAKEAFFKALGTGWRLGMGFNEIETLPDELGKPQITLYGTAKEVAASRGVTTIFVSLTHLKNMAAAQILLEK